MQIVIDIPDEQIKKSLAESKYIHENEGEKGSVQIVMLHTNARLESVVVERKTDFYSCEYKILPKGHGRLKDIDKIISDGRSKGFCEWYDEMKYADTIIEADKAESGDKE